MIALFYYAAVAKEMWMNPVPDGDTTVVRVPPPLLAALGLTGVVVIAVGIYPQAFAHFGDLAATLVR